jgi:hypothetical protein
MNTGFIHPLSRLHETLSNLWYYLVFQFRRADLFTRPSLEEMAIFNHKKLNQIQLRSCEKITDYHILDIKNQLFNKDERYFFTGS